MSLLVLRILTALIMLCAIHLAHAQRSQATIESPSGAPTVRMRWPTTRLAPSAAGKLVAVANANGQSLPFTFVIAPEDQGHDDHPMWLVMRLNGSPPYQVTVGQDVHGKFVDDIDRLDARPGTTLSSLPMAMIRADAWGPITATLDDAQSAQQNSNASWRLWILAAVVVVVALLAWIIAVFMRHQARREDVTKL